MTGGRRPESRADARDAAREGALGDLLEAEQRVTAAIRAAEAEAARATSEAKASLGRSDAERDVALEDELRRLESDLETERTTALAEIRRRSDEAARRFRDVDEARLQALAELVVRRVAEGGPEADGSGA